MQPSPESIGAQVASGVIETGEWGSSAWVMEGLDAIIAWGRSVQNDLPAGAGPEVVFDLSRPIFRRIADFGSLALLVPDEDGLVFDVASVDPPEARERIEAELRHQVEEGTFGWSLFQDRPVVVPGRHAGKLVVLHVMATPSRIVGMLMATLPGGVESLPDVAQKILSILLWQCAGVVESGLLTTRLEEQNRDLESRVELRTRELKRSREAALAASQAKSEFLANMSHEIRTPINGIMGMANLMVMSGLEGEAEEQARVILRSSDALLAIVNDILDTAKVEAGRMELEEIEFDLLEAIEDVAEMLAPRAHERGVDLVISWNEALPRRVVGDVNRLKQILVNLAGNAVKFTEHGHVQFVVNPEGREVQIAVEDTGIGIPAERMAHMFDKFTQADSSTSRRFGGTGLGLNISRELGRLMGGDIEAESEVGMGSIFRVRIPFPPVAPTERGRGIPALGRTVVVALPATDLSILRLEDIWRGAGARVLRVPPEQVVQRVRAAVDGGARTPAVAIGVGPETPTVLVELPREVEVGVVCLSTERAEADEIVRAAGRGRVLPRPVRMDPARALLDGSAPRAGMDASRVAESDDRLAGRVLVAEDDPVNTRVVMSLLRRFGHEAHAVPNGRAAVEALEAGEYDLVLMDWHMPEMDGFEATAEIRRRGGWADLPIVALTAGAMAGDREKCLEAGMDDYLTKPIRPDELESTLARWLAKRKVGGAVPESGAGRRGEAAFDLEGALARVMDEDLLRELADLFSEQWSGLRARLDRALAVEDTPEAALILHRIRGGAANVGAEQLAEVAGELERKAGDGLRYDVERGLPPLDRAYGAFVEARRAWEREKVA